MNRNRFNQLWRGQTALAKKVYEVVPVQDTWNLTQILAELSRVGGRYDKRAVEGVLRSLQESGLVQEKTGLYTRVTVREKEEKVAKSEETPHQAVEKRSLMETLGDLADEVRRKAEDLEKLALQIESVALVVEERLEEVTDETNKLRQLKDLLKELG